jgi:3-deoxy-D-manno-octulosonic-acid transferase
MYFAYTSYKILSTIFFLIFFPLFWFYARLTGRYRESIQQRLGIYPPKIIEGIAGSPRIWIHAASVGEVRAAIAVIESLTGLIPGCAIVLSTTTEHGQNLAKEKLRAKATCIYAPVDFIASVRKALATIKPDVLVCLETEIWPNWLTEAYRMGVKTAIVNGRISVRSIKGYLKIRPLIMDALKHVSAFSMIREADAQRIRMLGGPSERIAINGNAKYDLLPGQADESLKRKNKKIYNLSGNEPVFVAGSTRGSEQKIILDVYEEIIKTLPETLLIIAPRHVERARYLEDLVNKRGFSCQLRTDLNKKGCIRTAPVVIVDTIGDLQATYSVASIVFCGGSLEPLGGQNILEAAVWGKLVLYGPSMEDFLDAKEILDKTGGGLQVKTPLELAEKAIYYLTRPEEANAIGIRAKKAVMSNKGAADKHAMVIQRLLA